MRIMLVSIDHRHADLAVRERLTTHDAHAVPVAVRTRFPGIECLALSTCNRFELYIARPVYSEPKPGPLRAFVADHFGIPIDILARACVIREQEQAVAHLFRVCCGLESMVLGEAQVLGQVKQAYESASSQGFVGPVLHRVVQQAIAVAKQARTKNRIDAGKVSVGYVAAHLAKRIVPDLSDKTIVGIGAGEIAELTLRHLLGFKPKQIWIVNRTPSRAESLAQQLAITGHLGGARPWEQLIDLLAEADVIVTCTGSDEPILTVDHFEPIHPHRRGKPLILIDLASPRDVEPAVGSMSNVYLYNLDDLKTEADLGLDRRREEAKACEQRIVDAAAICINQVRHNDLGQLIRRLRTRLHDMGDDECERTLRKRSHYGDADELEAALNEHTRRLINKILHIPLEQLERHKPDAPLGFYAAALRRLFDMAEPEPDSGTTTELAGNNRPTER